MPKYDATTRLFDVKEGVNKKKCRMCQLFKTLDQFYKHPSNSDGLSSLCKVCHREDSTRRYNANPIPFRQKSRAREMALRTNPRYRLSRLLERVRQLDSVPCDLTLEYLHQLYLTQEGRCALTGWTMTLGESTDGMATPDAMSIDRVIGSRGYVVGNVRLVVSQINFAKHRFDDGQLLDLCTAVVKHFHESPDTWGEVRSIAPPKIVVPIEQEELL